jgi:hypothetical protein
MRKESFHSTMSDSITIEEHRSSVWKYILSISLGIAILFLILFLVNHNPLIVGIFRLIAFIGFAGFVMGILQLQGKRKEIKIQQNEEQLVINYYSSTAKNQEELFEIDSINRVKKDPAPPIWKIIPRKDCAKLQISFTDTSNILSLLRYRGQDIYVSPSDAQKAVHFLKEHLPSAVE